MASDFLPILWLHIVCAALSGGLFMTRGALMLANGRRLANHAALRYLSYLVDTTLLGAAVMLVIILHQYPFVQAWLTVKVLALVAYVVLGAFALRRGRTRRQRALFFLAALAVFGFIVSVAVVHSPWGVFAALG